MNSCKPVTAGVVLTTPELGAYVSTADSSAVCPMQTQLYYADIGHTGTKLAASRYLAEHRRRHA